MAISDEELVRRLESVPMVEAPDFREAVLGRVRERRPGQAGLPVLHFKRRLALGLAWAAAVAIVLGIAFFRPPSPQISGATMLSNVNVTQDGDRVLVKANIKGTLEFDQSRLTRVGTLPDGTVVLKRKVGATGSAAIVYHAADGEVLKTSVAVN
jgi:hypothetical protein